MGVADSEWQPCEDVVVVVVKQLASESVQAAVDDIVAEWLEDVVVGAGLDIDLDQDIDCKLAGTMQDFSGQKMG